MITAKQLKQIMPSLKPDRLAACLTPLQKAMDEFEINTPLRVAAFLAQLAHESNEFTHFEENLNYRWQRLRVVFRKYFPTDESAKPYDHQPQRIANRVYANRLGNGDEASGDGWRFRGRGPLQITGRENYQKCSELLGVDLIANPDLAATPEVGFRTAGLFWRRNNLNQFAQSVRRPATVQDDHDPH